MNFQPFTMFGDEEFIPPLAVAKGQVCVPKCADCSVFILGFAKFLFVLLFVAVCLKIQVLHSGLHFNAVLRPNIALYYLRNQGFFMKKLVFLLGLNLPQRFFTHPACLNRCLKCCPSISLQHSFAKEEAFHFALFLLQW